MPRGIGYPGKVELTGFGGPPSRIPSVSGGGEDDAFLRAMLGAPPARPSPEQQRNDLLKHISMLVGDGPVSFDQLRQNPGFSGFARQAAEAGLNPEDLVNARNRNIGDFESGGLAKRVGSFMDRSGLGDLITYGTIATAGLGGAGAFGAGPFSGGAGGAAGAGGGAGTLAPVTGLPSSISTAGAASGLPALPALGAPMASMPASIASGAAAGSLAPITNLPSAISTPGALGGSSMPAWLDALGGAQGLGSLVGGAAGLFDSMNAPDSQTVTQRTELPPEIQEAMSFLIDQSMGLADTGTLAPGLSDRTMGGIEALGSPLSGPGFDALSGFAGGQFMNPFIGGNDMSGVRDSITHAAKQAVGDRFSQAGRSGSPAEGMSLGRTIARELAPFEFGARENQMQRQFQGGENMLDRRLSSSLPLMKMQRQQGLDMLMGGGLLDEQARREAMEPFMRLDMLTGPLVSAISGAPRSSSTTTPLHSNPLLSGLGGALAGSRIGGLFG